MALIDGLYRLKVEHTEGWRFSFARPIFRAVTIPGVPGFSLADDVSP